VLTKDLLRVRRQSGELKPQWLRADAKQAPFVADLVELFRGAIGTPQGDLRSQALELAQAQGIEPLLVRGLLKVCFDAATTKEKDDLDYPALRREVFLAASRILAVGAKGTAEEFRNLVAASLSPADAQTESESARTTAGSAAAPADARGLLTEGTLYADLPDESPLTAFPFTDAAALLSRYNVALAQCLMVNARSVEVTLPAGDRALLRRLWKALRFHGLIARLGESTSGSIVVELEGPLSLHMHSLKYGFSLASFLPALLAEEGWTLTARVALARGDEYTVKLAPREELRLVKRAFNQYAPPELGLVFRSLRAKAAPAGWQMEEADDFLALPGEAACFPDARLTHTSGRVAYVEIFHPWHVSALAPRLAQLERAPHTPLILAVSRKAAKSAEASLARAAASHVVLFRETPVASDILAAAEAVAVASPDAMAPNPTKSRRASKASTPLRTT
jgi:predicted nuclease of restriction endonuclease-like RecB superfamily